MLVRVELASGSRGRGGKTSGGWWLGSVDFADGASSQAEQVGRTDAGARGVFARERVAGQGRGWLEDAGEGGHEEWGRMLNGNKSWEGNVANEEVMK